VTDTVGKDDVVLGRIQQSARHEKLVGKLGAQKLSPCTAGTMQDHHRIGDPAAGVALWFAEGGVVKPQLGKDLA